MSVEIPPLDDTIGAAYCGVVVSALLYGVSCVQSFYYFTHQADEWPIVTLVGAVMVFETVHQALISHTVYTYAITNFNNPFILTQLVWSLVVEVLFNGMVGFLVQGFLMMRVWRLSGRNKLLTGIVALLVFAEFGCVTAFFGLAIRLKTLAQLGELKPLSITVNALAAAGDVITVAGNTFVYITFFFCMGRLYSNSLLATLNARSLIRNAAEGIVSSEDNNLSIFSKGLAGVTMSMGSKRPTTTNISIKIDTTQEHAVDSGFRRHCDSDVKDAEDALTDPISSRRFSVVRNSEEVV
ncbi:hypothetical protein FISHEDRAFT_70411 [Fistulina hepatica ATCC 64428]|uniref:Uncharacterized protein n=1 Tax=Fistulina hepatica ATCC 64428 TaxID=1128425 RepID=A0A0D7AK10_9AGAR|nr:hypothetical protein FISHEDRAFT_70411 [Fistulina hepatica ATCC 64428]